MLKIPCTLSDTQTVLSFFSCPSPHVEVGCVRRALGPLANYPSSRWPRKWADILFMRRKIHFAEAGRDQVTPAQILPLDNCPSFNFHLIWIFQNQTPFGGVFSWAPTLGFDECFRALGAAGLPRRGGATWLKVNRQQRRHKSGIKRGRVGLWM